VLWKPPGTQKETLEHLDKSVGPGRLESGLELPARRPDFAVGERKLDLGVMKLLCILTLAQRDRHSCCLDNLDAWHADTMAGCHLIIHLLYSTIESDVSILLVHVVVTSSALVPHPNAKVLDGCWVFFKDLIDCQNLAM